MKLQQEENNKEHLIAEQKLIFLLLNYQSAVEETFDRGINETFFVEIHRVIVRSIFREYTSSNKKRLLTYETFKQRLLKDKTGKEYDVYLSIFSQCQNMAEFIEPSIDDLGLILDTVNSNFIKRNLHSILLKVPENLKTNEIYAIKTLHNDLGNLLGETKVKQCSFKSLYEIKDSYIEHVSDIRKNPDKIIKTNYSEIDQCINVGLKPGHLTLFVGGPGSHKTNVMLNIALNVCDDGHKVLFVPLEMPIQDVVSRILCNRALLNSYRLANPALMLEDEFQKLSKISVWEKYKDTFMFLDTNDTLNVSTLKREIEKHAQIFNPEIVIVDYGDLMEAENKYQNRTLEIGEMVKGLRGMGRKYNFHVITAAQMNRSSIRALKEGKDESPDTTSVQGSNSYSADSDTIFALMPVAGEPDKIRLFTIKARHGPQGLNQQLGVDKEHFLIRSDNPTLSLTSPTELEDDINRPVSEIENFVNNSCSNDFVTSDLDDDIANLGGK